MAASPSLTSASDALALPSGAGASWRWDLLYGGLGLPYLLWRRFVLKKEIQGWREKWGHHREWAPHPERIWIHAVSVGETLAVEPLHRELQRQRPSAEVVLSTTTPTGQEVARKRYGSERVFYYPLDFSRAVRRSFDRIGPRLIVLLELEVWPNFTLEAASRGVPVVVVNGRITARSAARYRKAWRLVGPSFRRVSRWLMQSPEYAERLQALGVPSERIEVAGNIKYDALATEPPDPQERARARADLGLPGQVPVLIGGSTHPGEEEALLQACRELRRSGAAPALRLVLVPRHPQRLEEVERQIAAAGFPCLRRSRLRDQGPAALQAFPQAAEAVILVDTMGELSRFYGASDLAFVGGSLIPHGGQNVMEPAGMGLPVIHGPHMHNFNEAIGILRDCQGSRAVAGAGDLVGAVGDLLAHPAEAAAMGARARAAFLARKGASARCVGYLRQLLDSVAVREAGR